MHCLSSFFFFYVQTTGAADVSGRKIGNSTGSRRSDGNCIGDSPQPTWRASASRGSFGLHQPQASHGCSPRSIWLRRPLRCVCTYCVYLKNGCTEALFFLPMSNASAACRGPLCVVRTYFVSARRATGVVTQLLVHCERDLQVLYRYLSVQYRYLSGQFKRCGTVSLQRLQ